MTADTLRRLGVPLAIAAAIVASLRLQPASPTVELPAGAPAGPSPATVQVALQRALAPDAPGYERGRTEAPVTVLEFADFGCRYCARFAAEVYPALADAYVASGRVRWRAVPFVLGIFASSDAAARAAICAGEQGRPAFTRMHDLLYARQAEWTGAADPAALIRRYAAATGLDAARFAACVASDLPASRIAAANDLADQLGVRATPTFFITGARVEGALPAAQFRSILEDELATPR